MSWFVDNPLSYFQSFCVNVIKSGPVPEHVAFIMDGNRRFARKSNVLKKDGHSKGFDKLAETLQWCLVLGIKEVTVYAFSIENFKRNAEEVDTLMELAQEKFRRLLEEKETLMEEGVCIRVIGNLSLVPEDIRASIAEAMLMTKDNNKVFLNVAFAYTSRDEITSAIKTVVDGVESKMIDVNDIDEQLLTQCLYTCHSRNPDLLVRTSGEVRFSDFLLWQIWNTKITFADVLWPEFCLWNLLAAIFQYQRSYEHIKATQLEQKVNSNPRVQEFLKILERRRLQQLECYAGA